MKAVGREIDPRLFLLRVTEAFAEEMVVGR